MIRKETGCRVISSCGGTDTGRRRRFCFCFVCGLVAPLHDLYAQRLLLRTGACKNAYVWSEDPHASERFQERVHTVSGPGCVFVCA